MRRTRMNTASPCRTLSLALGTLHFVQGNGMEEVVGSIPTRSTIFTLSKLSAPRPRRGGRRFDPDQVHHLHVIKAERPPASPGRSSVRSRPGPPSSKLELINVSMKHS